MSDLFRCDSCRQECDATILCSLCKGWSCRKCTEREVTLSGEIYVCRNCRVLRRRVLDTTSTAIERCNACGYPKPYNQCEDDGCALHPIFHKRKRDDYGVLQ